MRMHGGDKNQSVFNPQFGKDFNNALDYIQKLTTSNGNFQKYWTDSMAYLFTCCQ